MPQNLVSLSDNQFECIFDNVVVDWVEDQDHLSESGDTRGEHTNVILCNLQIVTAVACKVKEPREQRDFSLCFFLFVNQVSVRLLTLILFLEFSKLAIATKEVFKVQKLSEGSEWSHFEHRGY